MAVFNLFSKRNRPKPDKVILDDLPVMLRGYCINILSTGLSGVVGASRQVDEILRNEHPATTFRTTNVNDVDAMFGKQAPPFYEECLRKGNFDEAIDAIEAGIFVIHTIVREYLEKFGPVGGSHQPDDAIADLNARFVECGVGYQFSPEQNRLIRSESGFMYTEVTQPAMQLLLDNGFEGAAQEFAEAHRAYRESASQPERGKDAVAGAVKAVESTCKTILDARGWSYDKKKDAVVRLLEKLTKNGLVPADLECFFGGLRTALESGLPTIGNRMARHGQGAKPRPIEQHVVSLAMHLAASTIKFVSVQ